MKKGFLFVISGPSAVGKTVVANEIFKNNKNITKVVSYTTRKMRKTEHDGIDYHFVTEEEFFRREKNGDFLESSNIYGNYYGMTTSSIIDKIESGQNLLLVINWEGFLKIKKKIGSNVVGFFLTPPSVEELERRIRLRASDSEKDMTHRMQTVGIDMMHSIDFDYIFENSDIKKTSEAILEKIRIMSKNRV